MATIGEMVSKADNELCKIYDMQEAVINHRTDTVITWVKQDVDRETIKRYMGYSWEDYGLCKDIVCDAGDGCCHKVTIGKSVFCSPY